VETLATGFVVIGDRGPTGGIMNIYVDGRLVKRVNTYSTVRRVRQQLFASDRLAYPTTRALSIVTTGTRLRSRVVVDAIAVLR
jgi:alpha-galactosidase